MNHEDTKEKMERAFADLLSPPCLRAFVVNLLSLFDGHPLE